MWDCLVAVVGCGVGLVSGGVMVVSEAVDGSWLNVLLMMETGLQRGHQEGLI